MKPTPYLLCVTGLKNSGKTTVCTAVIADLRAQGYSVAALKSSHLAQLALDHHGGDSYALARSGAGFVLVQGSAQSLTFRRGARSFQQMLDCVPPEVDFIISEGGDPQATDAVVVCLAAAPTWEETLKVRRIPKHKIMAVSGSFAASPETTGIGAGTGTFKGFPLIDIKEADNRQILLERILKAAGLASAGP